MLWAFLNDLAQRLLTWNKREQRANLQRVFRQIGHAPGASVLDYGCGTGLFASTLAGDGLRYVGYDIDERLVMYGGWINRPLLFTCRKPEVIDNGPYDFVLANCCFHHISDSVLDGELAFIGRSLTPGGHFVFVDLVAPTREDSGLWRSYGLLEQGHFIRSCPDHTRLIEAHFDIVSVETVRSHLFSSPRSRLFTHLEVYVCRPRQAEPEAQESLSTPDSGARLESSKSP